MQAFRIFRIHLAHQLFTFCCQLSENNTAVIRARFALQVSAFLELVNHVSNVAALQQQLGSDLLNRLRSLIVENLHHSESCRIEAFNLASGNGMLVDALERLGKNPVQMQC
ncbi:hypothetical protein D3C80_1955130 [compost metagenome]